MRGIYLESRNLTKGKPFSRTSGRTKLRLRVQTDLPSGKREPKIRTIGVSKGPWEKNYVKDPLIFFTELIRERGHPQPYHDMLRWWPDVL